MGSHIEGLVNSLLKTQKRKRNEDGAALETDFIQLFETLELDVRDRSYMRRLGILYILTPLFKPTTRPSRFPDT